MKLAAALLSFALFAPCAAAADWSNLGGNGSRNGLTPAFGPEAPEVRWTGAPTSLIAWSPCVAGDMLYVVRQTGFVSGGTPFDSPVVAMRVSTGEVLWTFICPFEADDWTTVVYGVNGGRVYVGRGGNGSSSSARVRCLDAATGAFLWTSVDEVATGAYDGVVFADDGDPLFASNLDLKRIDAQTGATVWSISRSCSVSGDCGPAIRNGTVYIDEVGPGGQILTAIDAATGARRYSSSVMSGFLSQNTPFCGANNIVFYPRTQSNQTVDYLYAYRDTGSALEFLWKAPALAGAGSNHAVTADGGLVMVGFNGKLQVRDQETGALRHETAGTVTAQITQSHVAVDGAGRIFYGNGGFPGTLFSFNADLTPRWSLPMQNLNQGGPVIAADGTLLVSLTGTDMRAYRTAPAKCAPADLNCDGLVGASDLGILLGAWGTASADIDGDGATGASDLSLLLAAWS